MSSLWGWGFVLLLELLNATIKDIFAFELCIYYKKSSMATVDFLWKVAQMLKRFLGAVVELVQSRVVLQQSSLRHNQNGNMNGLGCCWVSLMWPHLAHISTEMLQTDFISFKPTTHCFIQPKLQKYPLQNLQPPFLIYTHLNTLKAFFHVVFQSSYNLFSNKSTLKNIHESKKVNCF